MPSSEVPLINPIARHRRWECCGPARVPMLDDEAMSTPRSFFLATTLERGFIHQCTDMYALDERLLVGRLVVFVVYDFSAHRLHVGSLVWIMLLRLFHRYG